MKSLVLAAALLFSTSAFAHIDASKYTCVDLQAYLSYHGHISIQRLIGWTTYTRQPECSGSEEARVHYEWTKDTHACELGWDCVSTGG